MQMKRTWRTGVFWPCLSCLFCPAVFFVCPVCLVCVCVLSCLSCFLSLCVSGPDVSCVFFGLVCPCCLVCRAFFMILCPALCLAFFFGLSDLLPCATDIGGTEMERTCGATYRWNRHTDAILAGHASGYLLVTLVLAYLLTGRACWSCWCLVAGCAF